MVSPSPFLPDRAERLARAVSDMRLGLAVAIGGGDTTWLAISAERADPARLDAMTETGTAHLAVTARRAETLKISVYDGDMARLSLPRAVDRAWLGGVIDPANDLAQPMKGPFLALRGGDAAPSRAGLLLLRKAELLPAAIVAPVESVPEGVLRISLSDMAAVSQTSLAHVVSARLPIAAEVNSALQIFRPDGLGDEHYAVVVGKPDRSAPVLTRLHSACFTGDVLGSLKCDCGPQLNAALRQMAQAGGGVLLYLNQEGRGIGLANKMRAYSLQDQGFDTVEANHRLGFDDDERNFGLGGQILRQMRIGRIKLMTNNPRKLAAFDAEGIEVVERVPLWVGEGDFNRDYLRVKHERSGHLE